MTKKYCTIDTDTGEIEECKIPVVEMRQGDRLIRAETIQYCKEHLSKDNFVWLLFQYGEQIFPNISSVNLTRLMYAATFCNQNNQLMAKSIMQSQLRLPKKQWQNFWEEMATNDILYEEDGFVYINPDIVKNGKIQTNSDYTRLFCQYVRQLYEGCKSINDHKQLSYIFRILPFVNRRTNIVCFNPEEQDKYHMQTMRLGDFCDIIGYDKSQARRLSKDLLSIRINGERVLGFFVSDLDEKTWWMIVNPKLYFGGKYDELWQQCRMLFIQEARDETDRRIKNAT